MRLHLADASEPRERCLAACTDDYVTKPIRIDALVEALLRAEVRHAPEVQIVPGAFNILWSASCSSQVGSDDKEVCEQLTCGLNSPVSGGAARFRGGNSAHHYE